MAKRVLIACGNGVATSTVVGSKVKDYCAANGVDIQVTQCKMLELHDKANAQHRLGFELECATEGKELDLGRKLLVSLPLLDELDVDA